MKKIFILSIIVFQSFGQLFDNEQPWKASWIGLPDTGKYVNLWVSYRKTLTIDTLPKTPKIIAKIATDTKYWLWINGKMVVFEGQLKRGPTPYDSYYDEVDITSYINKGKNTIAILEWYFGKSGFSHNSSGKPGLLFESSSINTYSDSTWKFQVHPAYYNTDGDQPNFRLAEHNIGFDATKDIGNWWASEYVDSKWFKVKIWGFPPLEPWGRLLKRPIPLFKDFGLKNYPDYNPKKGFNGFKNKDTFRLKLPYNAQITPYFKVEAKAGQKIYIQTDNYYVGGGKEYPSVRAEYICKNGVQTYENFGWMNGHYVNYIIPKGVKILELKYRETGYNTAVIGSFKCEDSLINNLWKKSVRTLYLNMRDTYFDCPDRERAQWWGDVVLEQGEAFYCLDKNATALAKKGLVEFFEWQKKDSTLFAPIPGNWDKELPLQSLAVVSKFGMGNYHKYSGDYQLYTQYYSSISRYLKLWQLNDTTGVVKHRSGAWDWGDWGINVDMELLETCWYYLAISQAKIYAGLTANIQDIAFWERRMNLMKLNFEKNYWNKGHYRTPRYKDETDDRANAMAVLSGLADTLTHKSDLLKVFENHYNASPYMEKYVLEALFELNSPQAAVARIKKRYQKMVNSTNSTLWEAWELNKDQSNNHGWTGGPLTLMQQYIAGIFPLEPGYLVAKISPRMDVFKQIASKVPTNFGLIELKTTNTDSTYQLEIKTPVPVANLYLSKYLFSMKDVFVNGKIAWSNGKVISASMFGDNVLTGGGRLSRDENQGNYQFIEAKNDYVIALQKGSYKILIKKK